MAIRRCPYCKAIIDESQKYCNNCGTQLLFPEDEFIEEPIKGEKITDEDFKDSSEEEFEKSLEESAAEEDEQEKEEIDLEDVLEGGGSFPGEERDTDEGAEPVVEVEEVEESTAEEPVGAPPPPSPKPKVVAEKKSRAEKPRAGSRPKTVESTTEFVERRVAAAAAAEPPIDEVEDADDAGRDLKDEDLNLEVEENKEEAETRAEIARLLGALEKKHQRAKLSKDEERIVAPLDESADVPPWADIGQDTGSSEVPAEDEDADKPGEKSLVTGDTMDFEEEVLKKADRMSETRSTIGIPETVSKVGDEDEVAADKGRPAGDDEATPAGFETPRVRFGFFRRIVALVFDLVFVAGLWLAAVGLATQVMGIALRPLVEAAAVPLGLLYAVLFSGYLFLFFFFLGETLGGRLVAPRR